MHDKILYLRHQNMRQGILCLVIRHSSLTKFILPLYYSHVIKFAVTIIKLKDRLRNTTSILANKEIFFSKEKSYFSFNVVAKIARSIQQKRGFVSNLEEGCTHANKYSSPLKIMPLGDSITYGVTGKNDKGSGGYRTELWNQFVADGLKVKFVGSQFSGPASLVDKNHEGHPGWKIRQIAASVNEWLDRYQPDLVLLMIGTNDMNNSLSNMLNEFSALIDQITAQSPNVQLLVASIPPIHPAAKPLPQVMRAMCLNAAIPEIVKSKVAQGKKVDFVDMRSLTVDDLTSSLSLDLDVGLHPNAQGYRKIANLWYDAVLLLITNRDSCFANRYVKSCSGKNIYV